MPDKKVILLPNNVWITKEDWNNCNKFEEDQNKKLAEFMYSNNKRIDNLDATTETN